MSACFWLCPAGKLLWKVLILFHCHGVLILPSALMTHETLTSCFIHVLTPPVPVVHASRSMFKCLVISPFVLLCPFWLFLNRVFFLFQCVSLSVFVCVTSAQGHRRTHLSLRAGKSSTSDLSCWDSDPWVSFRGPSKGWFDVYFLPVSLRLCLFLCLFA